MGYGYENGVYDECDADACNPCCRKECKSYCSTMWAFIHDSTIVPANVNSWIIETTVDGVDRLRVTPIAAAVPVPVPAPLGYIRVQVDELGYTIATVPAAYGDTTALSGIGAADIVSGTDAFLLNGFYVIDTVPTATGTDPSFYLSKLGVRRFAAKSLLNVVNLYTSQFQASLIVPSINGRRGVVRVDSVNCPLRIWELSNTYLLKLVRFVPIYIRGYFSCESPQCYCGAPIGSCRHLVRAQVHLA